MNVAGYANSIEHRHERVLQLLDVDHERLATARRLVVAPEPARCDYASTVAADSA